MSHMIHDAITMIRHQAIDEELWEIKKRIDNHHWFCQDTQLIFHEFLNIIYENPDCAHYYLLPLRIMRDNYHDVEMRTFRIHKVMKYRLRQNNPNDIGVLANLPNDILYMIANKIS